MKHVRGTVNTVQLIGWLGGDPERRFIPGGVSVCTFRVATNRFSGRDGDGKREYETDWSSVEVWDRLAEQCNTYLRKGSRVLISGSLRTDTWTDKETGQPRYKTYVRADEVLFLDARPESRETAAVVETEETADIPF